MKKIKFTKYIDKQQEGEYLRFPIDVPSGTSEIIVEYDYERFRQHKKDGIAFKEEINVIDFAIYAGEDFIGASGSNRNKLRISHKSDPGFANVNIQTGRWELLAGAYKVNPDGVDVHYTVTFVEEEWMLLKGDTHTHTVASDGSFTYDELVKKAHLEGLDFLILSDHNTYSQNKLITESEPITVIPGTEWTHYKGHANLLGLERGITDPFSIDSKNAIQEMFHNVQERGGFVSVNHPFCLFCPWEWGIDGLSYDCVEIWNGGLLPESNKQALDWWDEQLKVGSRIAIIGGSDFHKVGSFRNLGHPCTAVWSRSQSATDIIAALKQGHSYIANTVDAPSILLRSADKIQGDVSDTTNFTIRLTSLKKGDQVYLITDKKRELVEIDQDTEKYIQEMNLSSSRLFFRVEIYRTPDSDYMKMPISLSNPLYFRSI